MRRSYAARRESGTRSTHAAAGKRAGPSHRSAFLANWGLVTPVLLASSMNRRRLSVEGCSLGEAAMDLHGRDLGATVGLAAHTAFGKHAGDDEAHDGQHKEQRYSRDVSRLHGQY